MLRALNIRLYNAAQNILNEGLKILNKIPIRDGELTPLEIEPLVTEKSEAKFGRGIRKNQNYNYL